MIDNRHAGCDVCALADPALLDDCRAGADKGAVADRHVATQRGARCDMCEAAYTSVMVDAGAGVDDAAGTDVRAGLNDSSGHDLNTVFDDATRCDRSCRMNDAGETIAARLQAVLNMPPGRHTTSAYRVGYANTVDQRDCFRLVLCKDAIVAEYRDSKRAGLSGLAVESQAASYVEAK